MPWISIFQSCDYYFLAIFPSSMPKKFALFFPVFLNSLFTAFCLYMLLHYKAGALYFCYSTTTFLSPYALVSFGAYQSNPQMLWLKRTLYVSSVVLPIWDASTEHDWSSLASSMHAKFGLVAS